ncbi:MAG: nitrogen regulation protein NR(II) [Burkholderiaceae bacterium]
MSGKTGTANNAQQGKALGPAESAAESESTGDPATSHQYAGLQLLSTGVIVLSDQDRIDYINGAAEQMFDTSSRYVIGHAIDRLFSDSRAIEELVAQARRNEFGQKRIDLVAPVPGREALDLLVTLVVTSRANGALLIELQENDTRMRAAREERLTELASENRDMLRNLAHEVKNPLGGIRGAAQLLQIELDGSSLSEGATVIVKEVDRLSALVDRLLIPHRQPQRLSQVNMHEVCEHVRSLLLAEFPTSLEVIRDYDISLPPIQADREQLIQVLLNLTRNAAQALEGSGRIDLRTRVARQVTIARQRFKLALELHVIDNGPGIPENIRDRVFLPLVTGRAGGTGLGLSLVQSYVHQHGGMIECESRPGRTNFKMVIPWPDQH